jgi:hypothetical protein
MTAHAWHFVPLPPPTHTTEATAGTICLVRASCPCPLAAPAAAQPSPPPRPLTEIRDTTHAPRIAACHERATPRHPARLLCAHPSFKQHISQEISRTTASVEEYTTLGTYKHRTRAQQHAPLSHLPAHIYAHKTAHTTTSRTHETTRTYFTALAVDGTLFQACGTGGRRHTKHNSLVGSPGAAVPCGGAHHTVRTQAASPRRPRTRQRGAPAPLAGARCARMVLRRTGGGCGVTCPVRNFAHGRAPRRASLLLLHVAP